MKMNNNEYKGTVAEGIGNLVVVACHYLTREQAYSGNEIEVNLVPNLVPNLASQGLLLPQPRSQGEVHLHCF
jgi:hypothetical protein